MQPETDFTGSQVKKGGLIHSKTTMDAKRNNSQQGRQGPEDKEIVTHRTGGSKFEVTHSSVAFVALL